MSVSSEKSTRPATSAPPARGSNPSGSESHRVSLSRSARTRQASVNTKIVRIVSMCLARPSGFNEHRVAVRADGVQDVRRVR